MYFDREFTNVPEPFHEELRTLEEEGNIYSQFYFEEFEESRYCRVSLKPSEIVEYVDALTAYDEFRQYHSEGYSKSEAIDKISNETIKARVKEYNEWAKEQERANPFVPAAFYSSELESLLCGLRNERYEFVDQGFEGKKRELLRDIIDKIHLCVGVLQDRSQGRPSYEISCEQDIHDLLYSHLKPIFPESRVEEYTTKHADSSKKIDIVVPEVSTGIEVKYVRDQDHAGRVGDELKVDIESYHIHDDCNNMIAVIWDPETYIEDPYNFENDLEGPRTFDGRQFPVEVEVHGGY
jgi:hypothetical protein